MEVMQHHGINAKIPESLNLKLVMNKSLDLPTSVIMRDQFSDLGYLQCHHLSWCQKQLQQYDNQRSRRISKNKWLMTSYLPVLLQNQLMNYRGSRKSQNQAELLRLMEKVLDFTRLRYNGKLTARMWRPDSNWETSIQLNSRHLAINELVGIGNGKLELVASTYQSVWLCSIHVKHEKMEFNLYCGTRTLLAVLCDLYFWLM